MRRFWIVLFLVFSLALLSADVTLAQPQVPAFDCYDAYANGFDYDECLALVEFYNSTDGDNWANNDHWLDPDYPSPGAPDPCTWHGVSCQQAVWDYVTALELGYNDLNGSIPASLGDLTGLETLALGGNELSGPIPAELGNLSSLRLLALPFNQLEGSIPSELGNLSNLEEISLYANALTGAIPAALGAVSTLRYLELGGNQLGGEMPPQLGNLPNLEHLGAAANELTGEIPAQLGNLGGLGTLWLGGNHLTGAIPPELGNLSSLRELSLHSNRLGGHIPSELGSLSLLEDLNLSSNRLSGDVPAALANVGSALTGSSPQLYLDYNALYATDEVVADFLNTHNPTFFDTQTVAPTGLALDAAGTTWASLQWMPINYTEHGGYYEVSYATAAGGPYSVAGTTADKTVNTFTATGLEPGSDYYLRVRTYTPAHPANENALWSEYTSPISATTQAPATFACASASGAPELECQALVDLYNSTGGSEWTENGGWLDTLTPCTWYGVSCEGGHVSEVELGGNNLVGAIPAALGNLTQLQRLELWENELGGAIPPKLGTLANLTVLSLQINELSGEIPAELGAMSGLQWLNLAANHLRGPIPSELGNLSQMIALHLEINQLSGEIPPELGNLSDLWALSLERNRLSGAIPPELGNFSNLETLHLYSNQLSGEVPAELANIGSALPGRTFHISLDYNALYASDPTLVSYLEKHNPTFPETQTVAPTALSASASGTISVTLAWTPILYTEDGGYYEVSYATAEGGRYTVAGTTADKTAGTFTVAGLEPGTTYYFRVRTYTPAHGDQQNELWSGYTSPLAAATEEGPPGEAYPLFLPLVRR